MKNTHLQHNFFLVLLVGVLILTLFIFLPYVSALVIAGVFAVLFRPLYRLLKGWVKYEGLAALITMLIVLVLIITPIFFFGRQIVIEARSVFDSVVFGGPGFWDSISEKLTSSIRLVFPDFNGVQDFTVDLRSYVQSLLGWVLGNFGTVFSGFTKIIVMAFVSLVALYYFLKDGSRIKEVLIELSPLANKYDRQIFDKLHSAVNSVIRGSLMIAVIQGTLTGIGFAIFGVPNPALWGGITMISALIPGIGTSLVLIPGIIFLFAVGTFGQGVGLSIWAIVFVGLIDNFLGPRLIGRRVKIHELLILLSVLGGIGFFGPIGFIMGPLILSLLVALLDIYKTLILNDVISENE